jgi:hypothetical protein
VQIGRDLRDEEGNPGGEDLPHRIYQRASQRRFRRRAWTGDQKKQEERRKERKKVIKGKAGGLAEDVILPAFPNGTDDEFAPG